MRRALIERSSRRLRGWESKLLTRAGRRVLTNAVLTSVSIYFMAVMKLPDCVIKDLDKVRRDFFWQQSLQGPRKIHLASWQQLCKPIEKGGIGILDLKAMNIALLTKWTFKWLSRQSGLWTHINIILGTTSRPWDDNTATRFWKALTISGAIVETYTECVPVSGRSILMWYHNWGYGRLKEKFHALFSFTLIPDISLHHFIFLLNSTPQNLFRGNLTQAAQHQYIQLMNIMLQFQSQNQILQHQQQDQFNWSLNNSRAFSVKSCYAMLKNTPSIKTNLQRIWKYKVPPRMILFGYFMVQDKILTVKNLCKRGWSIVGRCEMCRQDEDSVAHIFNLCVFYQQFIHSLGMTMNLNTNQQWTQLTNIPTQEALLAMDLSKEHQALLLLACFVLWRERCNRIFNSKMKDVRLLVAEVLEDWRLLHPGRHVTS